MGQETQLIQPFSESYTWQNQRSPSNIRKKYSKIALHLQSGESIELNSELQLDQLQATNHLAPYTKRDPNQNGSHSLL